MSPRLLWWQGYTAREIAVELGVTTDSIKKKAQRGRWTRSPEGQKRLSHYIKAYGKDGATALQYYAAGWPALRGSEEERDRRFVRAIITEALSAGLLKVA